MQNTRKNHLKCVNGGVFIDLMFIFFIREKLFEKEEISFIINTKNTVKLTKLTKF